MSNTIQNLNTIVPIKEAPTVAPAADKKISDPVQADYEQGKRFLDTGNLSQAAVSLHNALLGYEEKGDKPGIANASNQLGHACLAKGDFVGAENHYQRAWDLCKEFNDPMSMKALSQRFIEVYRGMKEYDKAVDFCLDLLDAAQKNNDPRATVGVLENMAAIYIEADDTLKAADAYRTVASIHRNFKHKSIAESFEQKAKDLETGA
jgi:tetratricopeptide (TPR) repeat protein